MARKGKDEAGTLEAVTGGSDEPVLFQVATPSAEVPDRVRQACEAYGINRQFLLAWKVYPEREEVVLLTRGGKKVTWMPGMTVERLMEVEISGIPPRKS